VPETPLPPEPEVTVLVVTCNRAGMLRRALTSLLTQETRGEFHYEILVIDDGSTDHTPQVVAEIQARAGEVPVRYLRQEKRGVAAGRNHGVRGARGKWIAFCDDDEVAAPDWLRKLRHTAQKTGALAVGGRVVLSLPPDLKVKLGPRARRILGESLPGFSPSPDEMSTSNFFFDKSLFNCVGGFAEILRRSEDTDFFWKFRKAGVSLAVAFDALTYHIMPTWRCGEEALLKIALTDGVADAGFLLKYAGGRRLLLALARRLAVVLFRDLPGLLLSRLAGDRTLGLESRLGLWYAQGLGRGALFWTLPRLFPQTRFIREVGIFFPQPGEDHLSLREKFLSTSPHD
jgi:glycosyltransferase involved in cell wall biosynthesis